MPDLNATAASLLGFLHDGPKTGWDLVMAIEASVGNFWNVTRSQVYRELKTLADDGYASTGATGTRDRVPYAITKAGRAAFAEWIGRAPGDEIMRLPVVLTVFFGAHVDPALLARFLQTSRLGHQTRLDGYRAIRKDVTDPFQRATLDLGIDYEETMIRWLERLPWIRGGAAPSASTKKPKKSPARASKRS